MFKKLHFEIILKKKKMKSIEIIPMYISFCEKFGIMKSFY